MKKLFFVAFAAIVFCVSAEAQQKVYCEIVGSRVLFTKKITILVDFARTPNILTTIVL